MERTVPSTASEEIDLYMRTYYSLLRSSAEVKIRTLEEVHAGMNSLLHPSARDVDPDMSAFIYALLRLPDCVPEAQLVVLGQSAEVFARSGFGDVREWQEVSASARRRRSYYDGQRTLACFIASRSDIDDMIPLLTAFQIEWNKLHDTLRRLPSGFDLDSLWDMPGGYSRLAELLKVTTEDLDRLSAIWDDEFEDRLQRIADSPCDFRVQLLSGSLNEYRRATFNWWERIEKTIPELRHRPVYFVSSNTHSLLNVLSGFALLHQEELIDYIHHSGSTGLVNEWQDIQDGVVPSSRENFLYYVLKKYQQTSAGQHLIKEQQRHETSLGITRLPSKQSFDVEAQVISLRKLDYAPMDQRLGNGAWRQQLSGSDALIVNIDYPLGLGAYNILTEIAVHVGSIMGVYVMGKAATLNAVIGDVMISDVVHDELSRNTFLFPNCFSAADIAPDLKYGTVLDNQKSMTVQGTFLQNSDYMDVFYREGYTVIEMEAGPYLSAIYEMHRPTRHPVNEIVKLYGLPFDLGFLHYASDTPLGKGKNLGAASLSYYGMDSTYAVTLAIIRRIFFQESQGFKSFNP
jgi:hypothetical protein